MSQPPQYPPQQPGWGGQPQQPWPGQQPAWGAPPPPPPRRKNYAGWIVAGILSAVAVIAVIGAVSNGDSSSDDDKGRAASGETRVDEPRAPVEDDVQEEAPAAKAPVKVTAAKTGFTASILADGTNYTSVKVTVTNNGDEPISVNPLYFAITDTGGTKHASELGVDSGQIDTVDLAPGENVSGTVTGKGRFTPKYVTYTDGLIGDSVRSNVS
ncbi:DUF4352 domain-containing protein [Streptomyces phaeochromogenes]|uniref:DUF4352 domain-containing protein n=1 Tax=Streptomyces phaeochromogenes TaxID=1923 RepID=UPI002DDB7C58|nr:DUF4352 domain-containing protein [Streptomyces phaeochromogenes]WRZ32219.1 DUF4352 domain-containing protein [Streptomyces phaeochromogenes]